MTDPTPRLLLGRVPVENVFSLVRRTQPLLRYLEDRAQVHMDLKIGLSYHELIEGMVEERYDLVIVGPEVYVRAVDRGARFQAWLCPQRLGATSYRGMILVRADSELHQVTDLVGHSMAFVDPMSSAGYRYPLALLARYGVALEDLSAVRHLGSHDAVVKAVLQRRYDAGACFDDARLTTLSDRPEEIRELRVLVHTDPIPNEPVAVSRRLLQEQPIVAERLFEAIVNMHECEDGRAVLARMGPGFERFLPCEESEFETVREMLTATREG